MADKAEPPYISRGYEGVFWLQAERERERDTHMVRALGDSDLEEEGPECSLCCCEAQGGFRFSAVEQSGDFGGAFPLFFMEEVD